jgi:hypothetical protein
MFSFGHNMSCEVIQFIGFMTDQVITSMPMTLRNGNY